jgi:hypothetical protein
MYTNIVEFQFNEEVAPSKRFDFLARLAEACENNPQRRSSHHYFVISLNRNTECRIDFMMPSVFEIGKAQLRIAQRDGFLTVTKPKNFAAEDSDQDMQSV